jgi:hypothetical protein
MGATNRDRRKAKQKARSQRRAFVPRPAAPVSDLTPYEHALGVVSVASSPAARIDPALAATYAKDLANGLGMPGGETVVNRAVLAMLADVVEVVWQHGWQPSDLGRYVRREHGQLAERVLVDAVAARMRAYSDAVVDPRWAAQVSGVWWSSDSSWLDELASARGVGRLVAVETALLVLSLIRVLGPIPVLIPPPGSVVAGADPRVRGGRPVAPSSGDAVSTRTLERIRALLAKAESTTFPEEAETYTAKAQELMARHSIDAALIEAATGHSSSSSSPTGIRIGVEAPYEMAKSILLGEVSKANRCQSVWSKALGACTVFGFPTDLELVELLYTSLLVQATAAMTAEGSRRDRHGRSSTRSFRQAFLTAYATRIGERLKGARDRAGREAAAELGGSLLPVLAARDEAVQESFQAAFPNLVYREVSVSNAEGYRSGRAAADRASLNPRQELG